MGCPKKYLWVCCCLIFFFGVSHSISPARESDSQLHSRLKALNLDKYLGIRYTSHKPNPNHPEWEIYSYDAADCRCIKGAAFWVGNHRESALEDVMLYLGGGGICWPGHEFCKQEVPHDEALEATRIIPLSGWNCIYIPYCDGSVHMGDNQVDTDGDSRPDCWYWGLRGTSAAVALMKELYPDPEKILISGNSAGGYGTIIAAMIARLQYPRTKLYVFSKAGPGLFNPKDKETWETIKEAWDIPKFFPPDCERCRDHLVYFYDWMLQRDDKLKIGMASSYFDLVIGGMYMKTTPQEYKSLLLGTTNMIRENHPLTFKRFFIKGIDHNISNSYEVNGISIREWLEHLVNDSPQWKDILE